MARHKNVRWNLPDGCTTWEQVNTSVLMDIRDELQQINRMLGCYRIPIALDAIRRMDRDGIKRRLPRKKRVKK